MKFNSNKTTICYKIVSSYLMRGVLTYVELINILYLCRIYQETKNRLIKYVENGNDEVYLQDFDFKNKNYIYSFCRKD